LSERAISTEVAGANLPKIAYGRGSYLWDIDGKRYIDGSGGPAVYSLGHSHPEVNEAMKAQIDRVAHGYRYDFTSDPLEQLTASLTESCGGTLRHMVFVSGGSEATESAMKLAIQYQTSIGARTRRRFISRRRSWHGNTLGALSVSGFEERREPFEGALLPVTQLSPVNAYRPMQGAAVDDVAQVGAAELEQAILRIGPKQVAAFIFEPVVGAAGGVVPAPPGYARRIREICDRYGVVMIADEVMCGSGRCGSFRALEHDGVEPDIMPIAKGLGGGYVPLGAVVYSDRVAGVIDGAYGGPMTGHTFTGHTLACAAGLAVQTIIKRDGLIARVASRGAKFHSDLRARLAHLDAVGDVRGRGYFVGVEFVANQRTREPFDPAVGLFRRIRHETFSRGLICYASGGNVDGRRGDTVILAPPYNASDGELEEIIDIFVAGAEAALASAQR
jgi:adenosylmethionine-8-amino-7-oxononanoate aminotransferase